MKRHHQSEKRPGIDCPFVSVYESVWLCGSIHTLECSKTTWWILRGVVNLDGELSKARASISLAWPSNVNGYVIMWIVHVFYGVLFFAFNNLVNGERLVSDRWVRGILNHWIRFGADGKLMVFRLVDCAIKIYFNFFLMDVLSVKMLYYWFSNGIWLSF